jgi:hypothetical protein
VGEFGGVLAAEHGDPILPAVCLVVVNGAIFQDCPARIVTLEDRLHVSMKRLHLFEIHDQDWCPRAIRDAETDYLQFALATTKPYAAMTSILANAQKRGGKFTFISLNDGSAEMQFLQVPSADLPPVKLFDQQWALTLLDQVITRLRREQGAAGKGELFDELKIFLTGEKRAVAYAELALKLNTTEAALKMAVSRVRQRYGELLRAEIANTVSDPAEIEEELRALFAALS